MNKVKSGVYGKDGLGGRGKGKGNQFNSVKLAYITNLSLLLGLEPFKKFVVRQMSGLVRV